MKETLNAISNFLKAVAAMVVAAVLGAASWLGYEYYSANSQLGERFKQSQEEVTRLKGDVAQKVKQIEKLDTALRLMTVEHRMADIFVVDQWKSQVEKGKLKTKFVFQDVDDQGQPLDDPREFTIDGDILYVDAWVVKFNDELIQQNDPLRSTSLMIFRRLFGEFQEPSEGFAIDKVGARPAAYGRGPQSEYEKELWSNFWEYSNDPARAQKAGIRAAHGEAPYVKLKPGVLYKVKLRASAGLEIVTEPLPPDRKRAL